MRGVTRLLVVAFTAITAMVLFSAVVLAAAPSSAAQQQSVAAQLVAVEPSCPPVIHPPSTPVRRRCGQLPQTGQPLTLTNLGQSVLHASLRDRLLFLAGLILVGLGGGLIGLRVTASRR